MVKRCSRAALLLRNCLPEGSTQPLVLPKQVHPLALVIGSSGIAKGSDLKDVKGDGEEMRLSKSWDGFIIPDMKVDWLLGSSKLMEVLSSSSRSSVEKLVRLLEPEKLELVLASVQLFASVE